MSCSIYWQSPLRRHRRVDHWTEVVEFGESKLAWFSTFLKLPDGIASHDTFGRVFCLLNTEALENALHQWFAAFVGRVKGVVAIDGKSMRGLRDGKSVRCTSLASGPANPVCYSGRSGQRKNPMKSQLSQSCSNYSASRAALITHTCHELPKGDCQGHHGQRSGLCAGP